MRFPDFSRHPRYRRLLAEMGIKETLSLSGKQKRGFNVDGHEVEFRDVIPGKDGTLLWHDRRIFIYIKIQNLQVNEEMVPEHELHFADCKHISMLRSKGGSEKWIATQRTDGRYLVDYRRRGLTIKRNVLAQLELCRDCLNRLDWDGYRDKDPMQRHAIAQSFTARKFFNVYPDMVGNT